MRITQGGLIGVARSYGAANSAIDAYGQVTTIVDMNGTTDYLETYIISSVASIDGTLGRTHFQGTLIAPYAASGSGSSVGGTDT